jgi:hypothetical protein
MTALSASDILRIWEAGTGQDPVARALTILAAASPGTPRETLAALPVGRRDAQLLAVREETFGSTLESAASCPRCAEPVEFRLEAADLRARLASDTAATDADLRLPGWSLRYRLPTAATSPPPRSRAMRGGRRVLGNRCILEARREGGSGSRGSASRGHLP